jgi:hypothetical protein
MSANGPDATAEIRAIKQLKYRYLRAIDTQDWELMRDCVTEDFHGWYESGKYTVEGREAFIEFLDASMNPTAFTTHIGLHPEITLTGPDTAKGVWRMQDVGYFTCPNPASGMDVDDGDRAEACGYYYDDYVKTARGWMFRSSGDVLIFQATMRPDYRGGGLKGEPLHGRRPPGA